MNETMIREQVHQAVDNHCAHLKDDYWLAQRVIAMAQEQERNVPPAEMPRPRRKLSVALIVLVALMLLSVTAVAAVMLSARQIIEQELIPMAQEKDIEDDIIPVYTNAELQRIVKIARENNIELPQDLLDRTELGLSYWEDETLMIFAREAFGGLAMDWTIEQQHWYGEVEIAAGLAEFNWNCLPGEGEISRDEAVAIATETFLKQYDDNVRDTERWTYREQYVRGRNEETGELTPPEWHLTFTPKSVRDNCYWITISSEGKVLDTTVYEAPDDAKEMSCLSVYEHYERIYGGEDQWMPEVWIALHDDLQGRFLGSNYTWPYAYLDFVLPPDDGLTRVEAEELAKQAVNAARMEIYTAVCCMALDAPVWKVEVRTSAPDGSLDVGWWVELDATTGEMRDMIRFETLVGPGAPPRMLRYMPKNVYEEWLTIENG